MLTGISIASCARDSTNILLGEEVYAIPQESYLQGASTPWFWWTKNSDENREILLTFSSEHLRMKVPFLQNNDTSGLHSFQRLTVAVTSLTPDEEAKYISLGVKEKGDLWGDKVQDGKKRIVEPIPFTPWYRVYFGETDRGLWTVTRFPPDEIDAMKENVVIAMCSKDANTMSRCSNKVIIERRLLFSFYLDEENLPYQVDAAHHFFNCLQSWRILNPVAYGPC